MRLYISSLILLTILLETFSTVVFLVPVYEWNLVWKDVRNIGYVYGSIWRFESY